MKVKIIKSYTESTWYKNKIGQVLDVIDSGSSQFYQYGLETNNKSILKTDCEVLDPNTPAVNNIGFKVGDKVQFRGVQGVVKEICESESRYAMVIDAGNDRSIYMKWEDLVDVIKAEKNCIDVRITKCSTSGFWYEDKIGEITSVYDVDKKSDRYYRDCKGWGWWIFKDDCEIVPAFSTGDDIYINQITPIPADKPETSERLGCKNYSTIGNCAACYDYTKCDKFEAVVVQPDEPMAEPVYICDQVSDVGGCGITDCEYQNELKKPIRSPISLPCGRPFVKLKAVVKQIPEQQCQSCLDYKDEIARLKERLAECYDNPHAGSQRDLQIKLDQTTAACKKFNDNLTIAVDRMKIAEAKLAEYENFVKNGVKELDHYQKEAEKWRAQFCKMADLYIDMNEKWRNK